MVVTFAIGYYLWNWAFHGLESTKMRNTLIIINVLAWVLQFIGHGFFESILFGDIFRKKASFDG